MPAKTAYAPMELIVTGGTIAFLSGSGSAWVCSPRFLRDFSSRLPSRGISCVAAFGMIGRAWSAFSILKLVFRVKRHD